MYCSNIVVYTNTMNFVYMYIYIYIYIYNKCKQNS